MTVSLRMSLAAVALAATFGTQAVAQCGPAPRKPGAPTRILFIGNSYTYVNNLPELVAGMAAGAKTPVKIETEQVTVGGATLRQLWAEGKALAAIRRQKWDYVVLQEQSTLGATMVDGQAIISDPNTRFWPAARQFDLEIRRAGGKTVLYQTWAGPGKPENSDALAHAYFTIGKELEAIVIPAGVAWQRALRERPDLPLFMSDQSHPAPAGSYLTAMVTLATLFGGVTDPPLMVRGHQTGFDNKPADSVGTLASIDSETRALFGRIVTSVHREVEQAGGYLSIARPAMPALAPMPAGRPIRAQALDGSWKGTLTLFNTGSPAQLSLELRPGTGGEYLGSSTMQLDKPMRDDSIRLTIVGQEVRFSLQSPVDQLPIQFRGVLTADDRLEGRAVIESEERGWSFSGSWILTRAESH